MNPRIVAQALFSVTFLFALSGCMTLKESVCRPEFRADIPNFEGTFEARIYDLEKLETVRNSVQITRIDRGVYSGPDGLSGTVCMFDGRYVMESIDADSGRYQLQGVERRRDGGFDFIWLAVDASALDLHRIPYEVIDKPNEGADRLSRFFSRRASGDSDVGLVLGRKVVVDNRGRDPQLIVQLMQESSFRMALFRSAAALSEPKRQFQGNKSKTN